MSEAGCPILARFVRKGGIPRQRQARAFAAEPYETTDPDTQRVWWSDAGVHQNLTFPVHPDPITGMHCWHQMVRVERAGAADRYGDIFVDTNLSFAVYQRWKALTRPAPGPGGLRRPLWIPRVVRPEEAAFYIGTKKG